MAGRKPKRPDPVEHHPLRLVATDRYRRVDGRLQWYWRARMTRDGERLQTAVGWIDDGDLAALRKAAGDLLADGWPRTSSRSAAPVATVGDLLRRWVGDVRERPGLAENTVKTYELAARHLLAWLDAVRLDQVDSGVLETYRDDRLRESPPGPRTERWKRKTKGPRPGASPRTVQQELRVLVAAWRWGQRRGLCPLRVLDLPRWTAAQRREQRYTRHTPTIEDVRRTLEQLEGDDRLMVRLMVATGARPSDLARARREDLDLEARELVVRGKTGSRAIPLPRSLLDELAPRPPGPLLADLPHRATFAARLTRACEAAGVTPWTPYGTRRLAVNRFGRRGADVAAAAAVMGHSPEVMWEHYRQVTAEDRQTAVRTARLWELEHLLEAGEDATVLELPRRTTGHD